MTQTAMFESIREAVIAGDTARARSLAEEAVRAGLDPLTVLEQGFTGALRDVGDCWERGEMYLPEMMLAAEAVKGAMEVLKPLLRAAVAARGEATSTCILGTVKGDIHDIGKNIVGTLLGAFGFHIVDLGTDVATERFVEAARDSKAELMGLSALLTSTMPEMRTIIAALEEAGLRDRLRIAVGGAPVTPAYAREIGADGYANEGIAALRLFQKLATQGRGVSGAAAGREVGDAS